MANLYFKRQGQLLAFGISGAMALAMTACENRHNSDEIMIAPPPDFNPNWATTVNDTNSPPASPCIYTSSGNGSYFCGHGYYHVYGYPGYYYRPSPGSTVELVKGGSTSYSAGPPQEARESVARGGFGEGGGEGEGHGGGGEGGGHGGGGGE